MFLQGDSNTLEIQQLITNSSKLNCAVAFLGEKAELLLGNVKSSVRIICNLKSGGTNPNVVKQLLKIGTFEIRNYSLLHAKVYIGDNFAIVGSANLSANGLGLEADETTGWMEAGCKVTNRNEFKKINEWFNELWELYSKPITDDDIKLALKLWEKRQLARPAKNTSSSLFEILRSNPDVLRKRNIYLVISTDNLSKNAQETLSEIKSSKKYGLNVDAYEDWKNLPENSYFIDFYIGPRGDFKFNGIFKSPEKRILISFPDNDYKNSLYLCFKEKNIIGYKIDKQDIKLLKSKANKLLESKIGKGDSSTGKFISILEARKILFS